jgi:uncharacterized membrane protein
MKAMTAWTVLLLGALLVVGGVAGVFGGLRDGEMTATIFRLAILLIVAIGMARAARQLRPKTSR